MYQHVFNDLPSDSIILTANRRLAAFLLEQHVSYQQRHIKAVWPSIDILPFTSWLERCWQDIMDQGQHPALLLLNETQECILWEEIIQASSLGKTLLRIPATAKIAQQAWRLMKQWRIHASQLNHYFSEDVQAYYAWRQQFQAACQTKSWLDQNSLPDKLIELLKLKIFSPPAKIFLAGFIEINPQYQQLLDTLAESGCTYEKLMPAKTAVSVQKVALPDTTAEITAMARWAKLLLMQEPSGTIGCIVPNLTDIKPQVERIFTEVFAPEALLSAHASETLPFNFSMGKILKDYPIIHSALNGLKLAKKIIALEDMGCLLRSPFLGYAEQEWIARAKLDASLRAIGEYKISIQRILAEAADKNNFCPQLVTQIQAFQELFLTAPKNLPPSKWANLISAGLHRLGWPGDRSLDSTEVQVIERWKKLLHEFAQMDNMLTSITFNKAITQLHWLTANTIFQPEATAKPIHILGFLEAVGLEFQSLWIMGLHESVWPASPKPNPFIPGKLQRELGLPHASAEREFQFCHLLNQWLSKSASHLIYSYPQQDNDRELRPSSLLKDLQAITPENLSLALYQPYDELLFKGKAMEFFQDNYGPAISANELIRGGSGIFRLQSACPFRAFSEIRLGAKSLATPQSGLDAAERGFLLHKTLEIFWREIKTHEKLCQLDNASLEQLLLQIINNALIDFSRQKPQTLQQRFIEIEKRRLKNLLVNWLEQEKQRLPFTVVATEKQCSISVANIDVKLRVDRIDQLADNTYVIIDYKTGKASCNNWFDDRPDDLQLPLYCITSPEPIMGLVYAQIRADEMKFKGVIAQEDLFPQVSTLSSLKNASCKSDWNEQLAHWKMTIELLGQQFQSGYAEVDPKNPHQTCQLCDLQTLCRISERDLLPISDEN